MSEAIAEMVLPGTYIEVRSEGLIGAGAVSTGNLGVVGTAARGVRNQVVALSSYAEALDTFGAPDSYASPIAAIAPNTAAVPLSLVRALQLAFGGGARNVWAVRIANGDPVPATLTASAIPFRAVSGGTWGRRIGLELKTAGTGASATWTLTVRYGAIVETFTGTGTSILPIYDKLATAGASRLVTVDKPRPADAQITAIAAGTLLQGGNDFPNVSGANAGEGLASLEDQPVNVVLVAGLGAGASGVKAAVSSHLEATENAGRERIAVLGASASGSTANPADGSAALTDAAAYNDDRIVLVAPGLVAPDAQTGAAVSLPPPHLAAVVAGSVCAIAPHMSLTNKALPVDRLDVSYSTAVVTQLLGNRVTVVRQKLGFQVVKGITTDPGAFRQINVRRTVDYAKAGVRAGADAYIGKLNNSRVRAALKATLDGFLSQMVLDEMLVAYELAVSATRAQEIQGTALVTLTLQPTFSIDYIRVTMTLR